MNCLNCAAPLTATAQGGSFICTYCMSHRVLHDMRIKGDGIIDSNRFGEHDCPACGQLLNAALMDKAPVENCPACRGVLMTGELFAHIVESRRREYRGADERPGPIDAAQLGLRRDCPGCHRPMETHRYCGPGNTVLDSCFGCDLIWLDAGEPVALVKAPGLR